MAIKPVKKEEEKNDMPILFFFSDPPTMILEDVHQSPRTGVRVGSDGGWSVCYSCECQSGNNELHQ